MKPVLRTVGLTVGLFLAVVFGAGVSASAADANIVTDLVANCNLNIRNVPVITFAARFRDFTDADDHRHVWASVDGQTVINRDLFFDSSDYLWAQDVASTPGTHEVAVLITWWHYDDRFNASMSKKVVCPAPKPPPVPPKPPVPPHVTPPPAPPHAFKMVPKRVVAKLKVVNHDPPRDMAHVARNGYWLTAKCVPECPNGPFHVPTRLVLKLHGKGPIHHKKFWIDGHRIRSPHVHGRTVTAWFYDTAFWAPGMSGMAAWRQLYGVHVFTFRGTHDVKVRVR